MVSDHPVTRETEKLLKQMQEPKTTAIGDFRAVTDGPLHLTVAY